MRLRRLLTTLFSPFRRAIARVVDFAPGNPRTIGADVRVTDSVPGGAGVVAGDSRTEFPPSSSARRNGPSESISVCEGLRGGPAGLTSQWLASLLAFPVGPRHGPPASSPECCPISRWHSLAAIRGGTGISRDANAPLVPATEVAKLGKISFQTTLVRGVNADVTAAIIGSQSSACGSLPLPHFWWNQSVRSQEGSRLR